MLKLRYVLIPLLLLCLCSGIAGAVMVDSNTLSADAGAIEMGAGEPLTQTQKSLTVGLNTPFTLDGWLSWVDDGTPVVGARVTLEEQVSIGDMWRQVGSTTSNSAGYYSFTLSRSVAGIYSYRTLVNGVQKKEGWIVTVGPGGVPPTVTTPPTVKPITTLPIAPSGPTMAQAYTSYEAGNAAWSSAWGASDFGQIRMYLTQARTHFSTCLATANLVNDPANAANLALMRSVSTGYIALADAALAMYDGSDVYNAGRTQMNAGSYAAAAGSFQSAADKFQSSQSFFGQATATLQSVSFAGTSFGDGTAYIAAIIPVLNGKAAYVGEFATYARGWQHTALAYQASATGNQAVFQSEATLAMGQFGSLRSSATFGADATSNYNILETMLGGTLPVPVTTTPGTIATPPPPVSGTTITQLMAQGAISVTGRGSSIELVGLKIRNLRAVPLSFTIPIGTFLDSSDGSVQDMVTTETLQVTLAASEEKEVLIWAACADLNLDEPGSSNSFTVRASPPNAELVPILKALEAASASRDVFQAAVWIITDNADYDDLGNLLRGGTRSIDEDCAATAMRAIDQNGVDITAKAIWADRYSILNGITDASLRAWLTGRA